MPVQNKSIACKQKVMKIFDLFSSIGSIVTLVVALTTCRTVSEMKKSREVSNNTRGFITFKVEGRKT